MSIAAVQSRIAELQSAITAVSRPVDAPPPTTPDSDFGGALARALTTQQALGSGPAVGLPGSTGATAATSAVSLAAALAGPTAPTMSAASGTAAATEQAGPAAPGTGAALVESAKKYLGVPYVWGGESLAEGGLDCSGLVQLTFAQHGVTLPRTAREQMREGTEVPSLDQARPGDLIVTRGGAHIGIYVGDGQMIHSPRPGRTVEIRPLQAGEITTIRRVV